MKAPTLLSRSLIIGFSCITVHGQTHRPPERRDLVTDLTPGERLTLRNAIILYLDSSSAVHDHMNAPADVHSTGFFGSGGNGSLFLSWHRTYIQGLENYLSTNPAYSEFVPLPKWNPADAIPNEFRGFDALATAYRQTGNIVNANYSGTPSSQWDRESFNEGSDLNDFCCGNQGLCNDPSGPFTDFRRGLETFHNGVHGDVGGVMTTMSSPAAAIFWTWHAWIDDVYETYLCICAQDNHDYFGPNEEWDDFDRTVSNISGSESSYSAFRFLTTSGTFSTPASRNITFRAGSQITLNQGFSTQSGATFRAFIDACPRYGDQTPMAPQSDGGAP